MGFETQEEAERWAENAEFRADQLREERLMTAPIPDRVKADLNAYERATEAAERRPFDPWDDACIDDVCGKHLAAPIRALLFTLAQIRHTERSFGMRDHGKVKAYDALRVELDALEEACKASWRDL